MKAKSDKSHSRNAAMRSEIKMAAYASCGLCQNGVYAYGDSWRPLTSFEIHVPMKASMRRWCELSISNKRAPLLLSRIEKEDKKSHGRSNATKSETVERRKHERKAQVMTGEEGLIGTCLDT